MNNEAFERAKSAYGTGAYDDATMEFIFPQLAESEDERIRKDIINLIYWLKGNPSLCPQYYKDRYDDMLAYLEKKKEQKTPMSNDLDEEIERFFDECIEAHDAKIYGVDKQVITVDCYELTARHFAKWGEKQKKPENVSASTMVPSCWEVEQKEQKPAEWSEEDEVNKTRILESLEDQIRNADGIYYTKRLRTAQNWLKSLPERFNLQPKQKWNEEDKSFYDSIMCEVVKEGMHPTPEQANWFKTLPERFNLEPKQELVDEDEKMRCACIDLLEHFPRPCGEVIGPWKDCIDWLKSLRSKSRWKPTEEQMKALWDAYKGGKEQEPLRELIEQLKKM